MDVVLLAILVSDGVLERAVNKGFDLSDEVGVSIVVGVDCFVKGAIEIGERRFGELVRCGTVRVMSGELGIAGATQVIAGECFGGDGTGWVVGEGGFEAAFIDGPEKAFWKSLRRGRDGEDFFLDRVEVIFGVDEPSLENTVWLVSAAVLETPVFWDVLTSWLCWL